VDFNQLGWILPVLKLIAEDKNARKFCYSILGVIALFAVPEIIRALALLLK
jgi:hypothetical protein